MTRKQRRLVLIGGAVGVLAVAVALVLGALRDSIVFFNSPSDVVEKHVAPGARIRLGGLVKDGSVVPPAAWMDLAGRAQSTPDRNTRGWIDGQGSRHWLDVFPDLTLTPAGAGGVTAGAPAAVTGMPNTASTRQRNAVAGAAVTAGVLTLILVVLTRRRRRAIGARP